jgi:excisionase family DNA binding protein
MLAYQLLTAEEVATRLRVSTSAVYKWVSGRQIPFIKAGRHTIFDRAEVIEWVRQKRVDVGVQ